MKVTLSAFVAATLAATMVNGAHDSADSSITRRHHQKQQQHLVKRAFNGDATYYDVETGNAGACGRHLSRNEFVVAINQPQYGDLGQRSSWCGKTITISANGKSAQATVEDACPTGGGNCGFGSLDMSESLFRFFNPLSVGKFPITWTSGGGGGGGGNVVQQVVDGITGGGKKKKNNNNDDDDGDNWWKQQQEKKKQEEAAARKAAQEAEEERQRKQEQKEKAAEEAAASASAASASASRASVQAAKSVSRASASATRAAARASSSSAAAVSRSAVRAEASASRAAATAVPTGNLDKFDELFEGLNNMIVDQAA